MKDVDELVREYKGLALKEDETSKERREEILRYVGEHRDELQQEGMDAALSGWLQELSDSTDALVQQALRGQMGEDMHRLLPLKFIAQKYFGKSAAWLSQRVNGTKVRGRVYTLNDEQKRTFNAACQDIAREIGSFHLV